MTEQSTSSVASLWDRIPTAHKWAIVPAVVGFFFELSVNSSRTVNGVQTSCSYFDVAGPVLAIALVVMAFLGVRGDRKQREADRLGAPVYLIAAAYVLVAVYHFVTGIGVVGGPCN
jgi:hypothetical protein